MLIDYPTLRIIWWILLGALLISFAITDGFDLGIGMLLHRVARNNEEKRIVINSIGPIWEGNQIWLILGAGTIFAAWPDIYAIAFSGFYFAMLMVLFALILRPVGFKYRGKISHPTWRAVWDTGIAIAGFVPTFIFGVAVGNVIQGIPFYYDQNLQMYYTGSFLGLLNPFALLAGFMSLSMFIMHGGIFLSIKTDGEIQNRAIYYARIGAFITAILFIAGGFWLYYIKGYIVTSHILLDTPSNPLHKTVIMEAGAWYNHYHIFPLMWLAPCLGVAGALLAIIFINLHYFKLAWLMSAMSITGIISSSGITLFPFILPSSSHPEMSLLVWDSSSSQLTLLIMLGATVIFLPIIILYTSWVYYVLRGKITSKYIQNNQHHLY